MSRSTRPPLLTPTWHLPQALQCLFCHSKSCTEGDGSLESSSSRLISGVVLGSQASEGPVASYPLGHYATTGAMMPLSFGNPVLDVPPLNVVGFPVVPQSSSGFKVSMVRGMLYSDLQGLRGYPLLELRERMEGTKALSCEDVAQSSFERHLAVLEHDLGDRQGLVQQHVQERAQLIFKRDSLSMEVANFSEELEVVKAEMEDLQAWVTSLSARQDTSWEALHQWSRELEQLDSDSTAVTSLANSTAQEISHLQEEKQALLHHAVELRAMIEDSLDRF
ncbi:hypothetical protein AMTR_s00020p00200770 [Amborella trichopoda]|uniref:Uncharacterized protein n=1 Tax=Amborella trichopoda TaxID=13333 RepID=W1PVP2_AMBTC|nr:hypothetical protein AMTR_s00020p00200770 [Amborella trichopoda]